MARTVIAERVAQSKDRELASTVDAGLERVRRAARTQQAASPPDPEPEPKKGRGRPRKPVEPVKPITFVCNAYPAYGIGLADKMYLFQNGLLVLDDPRAIADMRKHQWFGRKIFERIEMADEGEPDPEESAAPLRERKGSTLDQYGLGHIVVREMTIEGERFRCALCRDVSPTFLSEMDLARHARRLHVPVQPTTPAAKLTRTDVRAPSV